MKIKKIQLKTLTKNITLNDNQTQKVGGGIGAYSKNYGACYTSPAHCPTAIIC
ncbi:hypothetical protein PCIT_a0298 [Pseudoalteromonas citrea]|uniref:GON domain-containing protein n=1 Tax=Pseudoalteromonas citrea TaxID=43655 RepID=A0AAD4AKK6_9GAMM|nr:hypothetical protein [Pseudoalteromonas citrea]KAF7773946.1 hypothetical protein PCIT_a0298 [Pseudoalteromonas citrea]